MRVPPGAELRVTVKTTGTQTARSGDHSSSPGIAPGIKRPTRGSTGPGRSLPARQSAGGLPSYLALLHAGFAVPPMLPPRRWALTPPFHPCQASLGASGQPKVLPPAGHRARLSAGGLFSVALSVVRPDLAAGTNSLALPGALPCGVRTFLPGGKAPCGAFRPKRSPDQPAVFIIDESCGAKEARGIRCEQALPNQRECLQNAAGSVTLRREGLGQIVFPKTV